MKLKLLMASATALFLLAGCGGSGPKPATQKQAKSQYKYVIGKTTINDIISRFGQPSGRSYNSKHETVLTYNNTHITGKAFIPFYYGSDAVRSSIKTFTFSKKGLLVSYSINNNHY